MSTGYDPNIEGAITVLVDLMSGLGLTMTRQPYAPNYRGLVDALIDLKESLPSQTGGKLVVRCATGEAITTGQAVYLDAPTGNIFKAIANATVDEATVLGFTQENTLIGATTDILVGGVLSTSGLSPGSPYFLSAASAGSITTTPPSTAGQFVTRVGEAGASTQLAVRPDLPIQLR